MIELPQYLSFLGKLFYLPHGAMAEEWERLPADAQRGFLRQLLKVGYGVFALQTLGEERIPEELRPAFLQDKETRTAKSMLHDLGLKKLYAELEAEKLRFAPMKGIDLAFRIYPIPSFRSFGDWDIFFHPDDIDRALRYLRATGWVELYDKSKWDSHHYSPMRKDSFMLEPHWTLSCCEKSAPLQIWQFIVPSAPGRSLHYLCPELQLMLLARHVSEYHYWGCSFAKLLLDAAFVMRHDKIDWNRQRRICAELQQPYSGNLFAAFPDFFPAETIQEMQGAPEQVNAYRTLFEERESFCEIPRTEVYMSLPDRFSPFWFLHAIRILFSRKNLRMKYHLPERGGRLMFWAAYCKEIWHKISSFVRYLFPWGRKHSQVIAKQLNLIRIAEKK